MKITPINDKILFKFIDETKRGFFTEKRASGIIIDLGGNHKHSADRCRLAEVVAVGPKTVGISKGDIIAIKALMWTTGMAMDKTTILWGTEQKHVIGVME